MCGLTAGGSAHKTDRFGQERLAGRPSTIQDSFGSTSTTLNLVAKGLTSVQAEQQKSLLEPAAYVYECKGTNLSKD